MKTPDILLINPPFHMREGSGNFLPLGLGYILSAVKNAGYDAEIVNCAESHHLFFEEELFQFEKWLSEELAQFAPTLIGIGPCMTSQVKALSIISRSCKIMHPNVPVVCGGPLATMEGQEWVFFEELRIPYIIKGDGEKSIPSAIKTLKTGLTLRECAVVSYDGHIIYNEIADLNTIAFPCRLYGSNEIISTRRKAIEQGKKSMPMITSRGCRYNCDYCVSGSMKQLKHRERSNENIINEMIFLRDNYGITDIIFYDDCFFNNPIKSTEDIAAFCGLLLRREVNMTWQMELRTDLLLSLTDSSLYLLEKSGCRQINIGVEKTTSNALKALGKTSIIDGLKDKNQHIREITTISLTATFILGGIGEDENSVKQLIAESKQLSLSQAHFNPLFVYPATRIYEKYGLGNRDWYNIIQQDILPWGEIVFENENLSRDKILELLEFAYNEFYGSSNSTSINLYSNRFNLRGRTL